MSKYTTDNIDSIITLTPYFLFNWHVTGWCNYNCPYCINRKWKCGWIPEEKKIEEAKKINELIKKSDIKDKISFRLIGGEPTYYNWCKILEYIERIDKIVLVTNFSRELDYFKEIYAYCKKRKIRLFLGLSKHDENKNFDEKAIELTKWCKENGYAAPQITIVAGEDFDPNYVKYLNQNGITRVRVSLLRDMDQANKLSQELRDTVYEFNRIHEIDRGNYRQFEVTFRDGTKEQFCCASDITNLMDEGGFNPEGFYCSSGPTCIAILPNSDVVRNKCDFLKDQVLGNLLTDDIIIPTNPVLCQINKKFGTTDRCCTICSGSNFIRKKD